MTPRELFVRLVRECLHDRVRLALLGLVLAALAVAQLALTWLAKLWAEGPLVTGDVHSMRRLLGTGGVLTLALTFAVFGSRYLLASIGQRLVQRIRDRVQSSLLGLSMEKTRAMHSGDAIARIFNDAAMLVGFVEGVLRRLVGESIVLVGAVSMLLYLNWRGALATLIVVPVVGLLLQRLAGMIRELSARAQRGAGEMGALLSEQLSGVSTIKAFGAERVEADRFRQRSTTFRDQYVQSEAWKILLVTSVWGVTGAGLLAAVWYGSRQVAGGQSTPGELLAFCLYVAQTIEPLRRLSDVQGLLQRSLAAADRVYEIIDSRDTEHDGTERLPAHVEGTVRFEGVRFSYRPGEPVIHDLDLSVAAGEMVGVVAASGGGKTTLASLLIRFADPQQGRITLDRRDVCELRLADLRRAICLVEQDPFVFSGSLLENLRYGSWDAPRQRVEAAVAMAGLDDFVQALPGGFDGRLVEGGRNLSGGQKQRIALARAIVREPSVLVLDEATSAIDSDTEREIFAQLMPWLRRRTVIVMAHRLSTVSRCPRVVVLAEGRVVGDGAVQSLSYGCPTFRLLFADQFSRLEELAAHPASRGRQRDVPLAVP
jgi:subfamily B ATP-binding cassette protein MsbA